MGTSAPEAAGTPKLRRALGLWDLILYGLIVIQPTAPMPVYGVMSTRSHGYAVVTVLLAMVAMLFTAISYGRMASAYPSAGSAFTYVGREIHPALGYLTGWSMAMDYMLNPLICTILCSKFAMNFFPDIPYAAWVVTFATLITVLNLQGIKTSARINSGLVVVMCVVIVLFLAAAARYVHAAPHDGIAFFTRPFFDPKTFSIRPILGGTSLAVLTYIGFDGISTLSEEAKNPRRNILLATVFVCLLTGLLASVEVYAAQLIWPGAQNFPDVDTAFVFVAGKAGGRWLFSLINVTLLVATVGSALGAQLGAARLFYGMGRSSALPRGFFGAIEPKRRIPRNNVLLVGGVALIGALVLSFERGVELLNFGALLAFMGVNCSALVRYYLREARKRWFNLMSPVLGFLICMLLWLSLSWRAKALGIGWIVIGLAWGAYNTRGFKRELVNLEIPDCDGEVQAVVADGATVSQR
jgi:amino acid transporter